MTMKYYEDVAPRDGFPDTATIKTANPTLTVPLGVGDHTVIIPNL